MNKCSFVHGFPFTGRNHMNKYFQETPLLNYKEPSISQLINKRGWMAMTDKEKISHIYGFVKDEILFGYNQSDTIPASVVLRDGYGQCNTKATLFMALLRAVEIPCRFHGFTINKRLQKGAIEGIFYRLAPEEIIHSWVEVNYNGCWINLEGLILDINYLTRVQKMYPACEDSFCGYGVATTSFKNPPVNWTGGDTYIQKEGIDQDFGIYDSPDEFYREHGGNLKGMKEFLFKHLVSKLMNRNIKRIRNKSD